MLKRYRKSYKNLSLAILWFISLTCCLWLGHVHLTTEVATAKNPDVSQLVKRSVEHYRGEDFRGTAKHEQISLNFQQTTKKLDKEAKNLPQVGRSLRDQAQAYNSLGQREKAIALLENALQIARSYKDTALEGSALSGLGEAYRLSGDYQQAIQDLQASLKIAKKIKNSVYETSALKNLGNTYISLAEVHYRHANSADEAGDSDDAEEFRKQAFTYDTKAVKYFQNSLKIARDRGDQLAQIRFLLNSIPSYHRTKAPKLAAAAEQQVLMLLKRLPNSQDKVYATIELAKLMQLPAHEDTNYPLMQCPQQIVKQQSITSFRLLNHAISIAQSLQDSRALSFALGNLGHVYECRQDYDKAMKLTRQAQLTAEQNLNAQDSLYLWNWQSGRILKAQNHQLEAIKYYEQAITNLENIGSDILQDNLNLKFVFRDNFEPIYRQLIELKLSLEDTTAVATKQENYSDNLSSVIDTIDALKMAEMQNYLGKDSVLTAVNKKKDNLVGIGTPTAVFSSIIFPDHTAIIVTFPNGQKRLEWIDIDSDRLRNEINKFRIGLEKRSDINYDTKQAKKLYNWIVRPFADDLESLQIKTLVFIPDGILRSVPMAALHDGEKFLVQKYAIATTPCLTLTQTNTVERQSMRVLALGLTKSAIVDGREFAALSNVKPEISQVEAQIPGSKQLLDENFTRDRLQQELHKQAYPIIHIATHGEFGSFPEDAFLVTGNNDKLTITELYTIIRGIIQNTDSVDLLTLTACETASGDDSAALGLAGVAVQAGVRSALASLWSINDASTVTLVTKFYEQWCKAGMGKAEALSAAQQALITSGGKYAHPAYWAPFILVGNWL